MAARRMVVLEAVFIMRLLWVSREQSTALGGEAVFLEAAVGFAGEGAFDEAGGKGGLEVSIKKTWAMGQSKGRHQFLG